MSGFADIVDRVLEIPIAPSFTKVGYAVRSRLDDWTDLDSYDVTGRTYVVTGATSGLGRATADRLARLGAHVVITGRDVDRTSRVRDEVAAATGSDEVSCVTADMGVLNDVRRLSDELIDRFDCIDGLLHNAGALSNERGETADGLEQTVASQVVGPFLLTSLLLDTLAAGGPGRVITMSSGGMYAAGLTVDQLQMRPDGYNGTEQYARAKRAQVTLNEMWAERVGATDTVFHAMHPGWADTPGVEASLPTFRKIVGPLLRSSEQGADTLVWLAADDGEPTRSSGDFWLDRRRRPIHKLPTTRSSDTPGRRARLWNWVVDASGAPVEHWD